MDDETVDRNVRQYSTPAASYLIEKTAKLIAMDKHAFGYRLIRIEGKEISTEAVLLKK
jgi:Icc protein